MPALRDSGGPLSPAAKTRPRTSHAWRGRAASTPCRCSDYNPRCQKRSKSRKGTTGYDTADYAQHFHRDLTPGRAVTPEPFVHPD